MSATGLQRDMADVFLRPVGPGDPITYWALGDTAHWRYDTPDCPMPGEMDPLFFVTKDKNFIPHRYPCRTQWIEERRDIRPEPEGEFAAKRLWLPFGSPRVDLSGFWFRPTRLGTWGAVVLRAVRPGRARLRLSTCGGAILYVNGSEAGWLAHYERNLETGIELEVELDRGDNHLQIYFDDLAERDTRYYFELDYLSGPKIAQVLDIDADPNALAQIEQALEGMHFSKPSYLSGPVALLLDEALAFDVAVEVRIEGDFMSRESARLTFSLAAGERQLVLGQAEDLPADFRHFHVSIGIEGCAAERVFGVEICHAGQQGKAPGELGQRIEEALAHVSAHSEADTVRALAQLASGRGDADTETMIGDMLASIEDCHDCADFVLVPLLWCRMRFSASLSGELVARIDRTILGYRYWMDEPGNDVQWYFSENHALLFHTAAYLAGQFLPDQRFVRSGRSGAAQSQIGAQRVRAWFDHFEQWEMAEFNSAPYFPIDLKGLTALFALAPDADIRDRAKRAIQRLLFIVAQSAHHGHLTGAQGRSYEHTLRAAGSLELSGIARLAWGTGFYGRRVHVLPQLALCLRDHGLEIEASVGEIADFKGHAPGDEAGEKTGAREWVFAQGKDRFAKLYHYKTAEFALGSAAHYRWGEWGYQETLLHARVGTNPNAQVWINHPGEVIHCGFGRPSFWGGSGRVPRVQQYRGLALMQFEPDPAQVGFTHAWFPRTEFDEVLLGPNFAVARSGEGLIALRTNQALVPITTGPTADCELRTDGPVSRWLVRLGRRADFASLDEFGSALTQPAWRDEGGAWAFEDPEYGLVTMGEDAQVLAEGRRLDPTSWTIAGHAQHLAVATARKAGAA